MAAKDDAESFMSLEDDSPKPSRKKGNNKVKSPVKPSQSSNQEILDAEIIDTTVVEQAGGHHNHARQHGVAMGAAKAITKIQHGTHPGTKQPG